MKFSKAEIVRRIPIRYSTEQNHIGQSTIAESLQHGHDDLSEAMTYLVQWMDVARDVQSGFQLYDAAFIRKKNLFKRVYAFVRNRQETRSVMFIPLEDELTFDVPNGFTLNTLDNLYVVCTDTNLLETGIYKLTPDNMKLAVATNSAGDYVFNIDVRINDGDGGGATRDFRIYLDKSGFSLSWGEMFVATNREEAIELLRTSLQAQTADLAAKSERLLQRLENLA